MWRWGISPQLWHLRKHLCYRSTSVCCCYLVIPTGPGLHLGSVSKALLTMMNSLENVMGRFVSVSELLGLLAGFWSSDIKWGFHHLSSQPVLQCMFYIGQDIAGTMLVAQVSLCQSLEDKCHLHDRRTSASSCSSQSDSSGHPAYLAIQTPPSLPSSIQTSWTRTSVFSKCCEMYTYNIISWLYSWKLWWQPAGAVL